MHEKAMKKYPAYAEWHQHQLSEVLSWAMFFAISFMAFNIVAFDVDQTVALERYALVHPTSHTMALALPSTTY
jgi:hypothetical protein